MKLKSSHHFAGFLRRILTSSALMLQLSSPLMAADFTWDTVAANGTISGGTGAWNTTGTNLTWTTDAGATNVAWSNTPLDNHALFGDVGGTVTATTVSTNRITFNSAGYTIAGSAITLNGSTPTITANADATISSIVAGSAGLKLRYRSP